MITRVAIGQKLGKVAKFGGKNTVFYRSNSVVKHYIKLFSYLPCFLTDVIAQGR